MTCIDCDGEMKAILEGALIECSSRHMIQKTIGSEEIRTSKCRACGEEIIFMPTKAGKLIPVNADTYDYSKLFDIKKHTSHFATCPQAKQFRSSKPKRK